MNKASPVDMRKCLEAVESLKKAGIYFVPIPILSERDKQRQLMRLGIRLQKLSELADQLEHSDDLQTLA